MAASEFLEFCGVHVEHRLCGFLLYSQWRFRCGPELFYNDGSEQSSIAGAGQWRERRDKRGVHLWEQQPVPFKLVPGFELLGRRGVRQQWDTAAADHYDYISTSKRHAIDGLYPDPGSDGRHFAIHLGAGD